MTPARVTVAILFAACSNASPLPPPDADPAASDAACVSDVIFGRFDPASTLMNPGQPCITCHRSAYDEGNRSAVVWSVAGTVFNARHEVNNCFGFAGSPTGEASTDPLFVELTDANERTLRIGVNRAGNFMSVEPLRGPFRNVRVVHTRGAFRVMRGPAPHGDCNACHTRMGTTTVPGGLDAPGRIVAP